VTGFGALYNNSSDENSAFGVFTLYNNSTGSQNTGLGTYSLYFNSTGDSNTACGYKALFNNTTGFDNTATGALALLGNTTGFFNCAFGYLSLQTNTTGDNNSAFGRQALTNNTSGSDNTALGTLALYDCVTGRHNTAVGSGSSGTNISGSFNTSLGFGALYFNSTGDSNTAVGSNANVTATSLVNATAIGYGAQVNASNKVRIGNTNVTKIEGQVAYTFTSDRNQKENFQPIDGDEVLRKISKFDLSSWNYKKNDPTKFRHYGPMAQEFFAAFGHDAVGQCGDSVTMNSGDEAGILFAAVQALEKRTAEMKAVKAENADLRARLERLELLVTKLAATSPEPAARLAQK
jgi:trimeric autotransporter adhesin